MPYVTAVLLVVIIAMFIAGTPINLALWPIPSAEFRPWQLVTYAFLHGNVLHLLVNVIGLMSFGPVLERKWGRVVFLTCYLLAAIVGGAWQATMGDRPVVGASGALFGLFAAYVVHKPQARVITLFPWPLPAWIVLAAYVGCTVIAVAMEWGGGIAHLAHLGGIAVGAGFALNDKPRR